MFKLKKMVPVLLVAIVALLVMVAPVAEARVILETSQPLESTGIFTDLDGNTMDYEIYIYSLTIYADASSSFVGLYDAGTTAELQVATARDEIGEATQYDWATKYYNPPIKMSDGVGGVISTGVAFVTYGAEPEN